MPTGFADARPEGRMIGRERTPSERSALRRVRPQASIHFTNENGKPKLSDCVASRPGNVGRGYPRVVQEARRGITEGETVAKRARGHSGNASFCGETQSALEGTRVAACGRNSSAQPPAGSAKAGPIKPVFSGKDLRCRQCSTRTGRNPRPALAPGRPGVVPQAEQSCSMRNT